MRESEATYRSLIEGAPFGIFRSSIPQGQFLAVNPALATMLGYSQEELLTLKLSTAVYVNPQAREQALQRFVDLEVFVGEELQLKHKSGKPVAVRLSGRTIRDQSGKVTALEGFVEDVSERQQMERQLLQRQKLDAVGRLAGGIAHGFNNLLGVIIGNAELLKDLLPRGGAQEQKLGEILRAAQRGAGLTRQLLTFSRKQVTRPKIIDLNVLIRETEQMLRRLIGENIRLSTSLDPNLWCVWADSGQLEQVLVNLAVNARDAMPSGGLLSIRTRNITLDTQQVAGQSTVPPGDYVDLAVSDTGSGMDPETQAHIFEPFFTTKEVGKGTGLGLATVLGTVEQVRGHIWVYSEPGKGCTFKMYLPRSEQVANDHAEPELTPTTLNGAGTILLVEDESALRSTTAQFLRAAGYEVVEAGGGTDAVISASYHQEQLDLLVTDVVMPGMSGRQLADLLRGQRPGLKVLYMSGYTDDVLVHQGVLASGISILEKPFSRLQLLQAVKKTLDESARGPAVAR